VELTLSSMPFLNQVTFDPNLLMSQLKVAVSFLVTSVGVRPWTIASGASFTSSLAEQRAGPTWVKQDVALWTEMFLV
jgi:hypothetical protein